MLQSETPGSQFKNILESINAYPEWIKEALYIHLKDDLRQYRDINKLNALASADCIYLYVPKLARSGQMFLENALHHESGYDKRLVSFINSIKMQKNLIDIAQDNDLTLKTTCLYLLKCWEKNLVQPTYSKTIYALVRLLAGDIDMCDYLFRVGRITKEQYDWVARMQNNTMVDYFGESSSKEDIFINLGYIAPDELDSLTRLIKISESKHMVEDRNFILVMKLSELKKQIQELTRDNKILQEDRTELEKKVKQLSAEIIMHKTEKNQYFKEIASLKEELKKALKG